MVGRPVILIKSTTALCLLAAGLAMALAGQSVKAEDLPGLYKDFLNLTSYIMLPQEKEVFLSLRDDRERDIFIEAFWKQRDPTSGTPENEFKAEHIQRFDHANRYFRRGATREGWMTDMGRIYIILGPPASTERFEMTAGLYPTQVWYYYGDVRKGLPVHFAIIFFQRGGAGEYRLYDHTADGPGSLMIHTRTTSGMDFSQLYEDLKELAPTLADVAISMIPGDVPFDYQPSPMNALIMADVFESAKRAVNATYATHFLKYKGIVSTEYMTNFVESEALVAVIRDPFLGLDFLHVSIVP
jgi:GWxTD domain-containing protein